MSNDEPTITVQFLRRPRPGLRDTHAAQHSDAIGKLIWQGCTPREIQRRLSLTDAQFKRALGSGVRRIEARSPVFGPYRAVKILQEREGARLKVVDGWGFTSILALSCGAARHRNWMVLQEPQELWTDVVIAQGSEPAGGRE
jgi:hypothetical protein